VTSELGVSPELHELLSGGRGGASNPGAWGPGLRAQPQPPLRREQAGAEHQRKKDFALFVIVAVMVCIVATACLWVNRSSNDPPEVQKWVSSRLTVIVSASLGYMIGKRANRKYLHWRGL
jgi:hypothetical protein